MGQKVSGELYLSPCFIPSQTQTTVGLSRRKGPSKRIRTTSGNDESIRPSMLDFLLDGTSSLCDPGLQLANSWNPDDRSPFLRIRRDDPLTIRRVPVQDTTDAIRTKIGYSRGLHAWTIRWRSDQRGTHAVIGVATSKAPLRAFGYKCLIGDNEESWGLDIVKNRLWHNKKCLPGLNIPSHSTSSAIGIPVESNSPIIPDDITLILDMESGTVSFAVGGHYLGVAFSGLKGKTIYPAVSAVWGHCQVSIKYIGSLESNPPLLSELCRRVIRQQIGRNRIEESLQRLPLPPLLIQFLR